MGVALDMKVVELKYIRCPNCNKVNGAISLYSIGVQQLICKDSRCRHEFYVVDGVVDKAFDKSSVKLI